MIINSGSFGGAFLFVLKVQKVPHIHCHENELKGKGRPQKGRLAFGYITSIGVALLCVSSK